MAYGSKCVCRCRISVRGDGWTDAVVKIGSRSKSRMKVVGMYIRGASDGVGDARHMDSEACVNDVVMIVSVLNKARGSSRRVEDVDMFVMCACVSSPMDRIV